MTAVVSVGVTVVASAAVTVEDAAEIAGAIADSVVARRVVIGATGVVIAGEIAGDPAADREASIAGHRVEDPRAALVTEVVMVDGKAAGMPDAADSIAGRAVAVAVAVVAAVARREPAMSVARSAIARRVSAPKDAPNGRSAPTGCVLPSVRRGAPSPKAARSNP